MRWNGTERGEPMTLVLLMVGAGYMLYLLYALLMPERF